MIATKIRIDTAGYSFDAVKNDNNLKLIAFEYLIPRPLFPPVKRISELHSISEDSQPSPWLIWQAVPL